MDPGSGARRPHEGLEGVGAVLTVMTVGHVPVPGPLCFLEEWEDPGLQKPGFIDQTGQEGSGFSQGRLCEEVRELEKLSYLQRG